MTRYLRTLLPLAVIALLAVTFVTFRPHAQEVTAEEPPPVSDKEVDTYIAVYKAMQADHGLTIEEAIQPHALSLEEFRHIERRVQDDPRLVDKVRESLLEYAKKSSAMAAAMESPTPSAAATPAKGKKKK